jgi:DNA-binding beta-propeller fold protein YncE
MLRRVAPALIALALVSATSAQAATEGTLVQLPGDTGSGATGVTLSPDGTSLYSVTPAGVIAYSRDAKTGTLTAVSSQGPLAHQPEVAPVVAPDGLSAYGGSAVLARDPLTGVLTDAGTIPGTGLGATVVSPDGLSVYVASADQILAFARVSLTPAGSVPFSGTKALAASPDGRSLYAASDGGVAAFSRDPLTGVLTAVGCLGDSSGCTPVRGLKGPTDVAVSPDGANVYVTSGFNGSGGVVAFARDATSGALTQLPDAAGCINESDPTCTDTATLVNAHAVVLSPDGRYAYVGSFDGALTTLSRDRVTGALKAVDGPDGCLAADQFPGLPCGTARALWQLGALAISPDGANVYGAAGDSGLSAFERLGPTIIVDPPTQPVPPAGDPPAEKPAAQLPAPDVPAAPTLPVRVIVEAPHAEDEPTVEVPALKLIGKTTIRGLRSGNLRVVVRCDRACSGIVSAYASSKGKLTRLAGKRIKLKKKGDKVVNLVVTGKNLTLLRKSGTGLVFRARAS